METDVFSCLRQVSGSIMKHNITQNMSDTLEASSDQFVVGGRRPLCPFLLRNCFIRVRGWYCVRSKYLLLDFTAQSTSWTIRSTRVLQWLCLECSCANCGAWSYRQTPSPSQKTRRITVRHLGSSCPGSLFMFISVVNTCHCSSLEQVNAFEHYLDIITLLYFHL